MLGSEAFRETHRVKPSDFTRKRSLPLPVVVGFLLQLCGGVALQGALDAFFCDLRQRSRFVREVTKSAFCQARQKLHASAFAALNHWWVEHWHLEGAFERWCGLRVVAVDGTCLRLPRWGENVDAYGRGPCGDGSVVMARCVALFSTATRQVLDITVGRYDASERELLVGSLGAVKAGDSGDVLVLDRGYPAWWLFAALQAKGVAFCARIEGCSWPQVARFMACTQSQLVIERTVDRATRSKLAALGLQAKSLVRLRLVKVVLPNGYLEVLATSLLDDARYPGAMFGALYRSRWGIEEAFKTLKHRLNLEGFSGELPQAIEQEIHAKALMYNITQALCSEATERLSPTQMGVCQVNHAYALKHAARLVVCWLRGAGRALAEMVEAVVTALANTLERRRPDRSFPRNHRYGGALRPRKNYR